MHPTSELYDSLQRAYEHFNLELFEGLLPKVIFTVQRKKGVTGYFAKDRWGNLNGKKCHEIAINPSYIANSRLVEVMQTLVHEMVHCWQFCYGSPGRDHYHNKEWAKKMIQVGLMPSSTGEPGGAITGQHMSDYIIENGSFLRSFNSLKQDKQFQLNWIDRLALPRLFEPIIAAASIEDLKEGNEITELVQKNLPVGNSETGYVADYEDLEDKSFSEILPEAFIVEEAPIRKTRTKYICTGCSAKIYGKANLNIRCDDCNRKFIPD